MQDRQDGWWWLLVCIICIHVYSHELLTPCSISSVHNDLQSLIYCCCSVTEPGVPYTVTVRASTAVGKGEPVSIIVFSVEQGKSEAKVCTRKIVM